MALRELIKIAATHSCDLLSGFQARCYVSKCRGPSKPLVKLDTPRRGVICFAVEAEEHSGWTADDCIREANDRFSAKREQLNANALEMYKKNPNSKKTKPRPKHDVFRFMHCYDVLKNSVRFMRAVPSPRKRSLPRTAGPSDGNSGMIGAEARVFSMDNVLDGDDSETSESDSVAGRTDNQSQRPARPKGKKQAKAANLEASVDRSMAHSQRELAKATAAQVDIMKEQLSVAKKKNKLMEEQAEML
ncbi:hypothetical protein PHYPSEUDO_011785 [Phytophthora pseudosyringae]|uniref:No apical meristem-associated C-terminal domain-containing protein n=1 Tax=Phytophthora pseudosyringae TaxID=221518 RepID=A0A8T1W679_9STRA|nr:hypothetical protein PHYPSEUDO_011785 [Phytophthora pseudosyringae]